MHSYIRLAAMTALSFISMYILMYAMVDRLTDVYSNINQVYMAGLMTAPMVVIELLLMGAMYKNKAANAVILTISVVALGACWILIRQQTAVGDRQFLRSMIPHHSGAILMCREAALTDAEIKTLCGTIATGQQSEIDQMNTILKRLNSGG